MIWPSTQVLGRHEVFITFVFRFMNIAVYYKILILVSFSSAEYLTESITREMIFNYSPIFVPAQRMNSRFLYVVPL